MQIQLNQDSTNFSVPFIQDTQLVSIDSSDFKDRIRDTLKQKKKELEIPNKIRQEAKIVTSVKEVVSDTIDIDCTATSFSCQFNDGSIDYIKVDSIERFLNFSTTKINYYNNGIPIEKLNYTSWQWIILLLTIGLIGATRAFNRKRFSEYIQAIFSRNASIQIIRNEKVYGHRANIFFTTAYFLTTSLLGLQIADLNGLLPKDSHFTSFWLILAILTVAYFFKAIIHKLLAIILSFSELAQEYIFTISLYNIAALFMILPSTLIASYGPSAYKSLSLSIAVILMGISISARIIRGVQIGINGQINLIYLFLYLCTLEILPLIIVFKILFN